LFDAPGSFPLVHRTPDRTYHLGSVVVSDEPAERSFAAEFETLHHNRAFVEERARVDADLRRPPDRTLIFAAEMPILYDDDDHGGGRAHDSGDGLEWEDLMPDINARTDATNMIWKLIDGDTGRENQGIDWSFRVGDRVKIRLVDTMDSDHPMHHPFHMHGAGRFLVTSRVDAPEPNLVWKDTVLVRAGETVDVVLDVTSPGLWMATATWPSTTRTGWRSASR
jgi:hypothetical protein